MSLATEGFSVIMSDLDMGQESNSLKAPLQVKPLCDRLNNCLAYPSLTKYFPGNCLTRRLSSSCNNVDETAALDKLLLAAMSSIEVSVASIASYTRRSSSESGGNGRAAASGEGFVSGRRICKSSRISDASMTSFAPCWMRRFDPIALGALICPGTA